MAHLHKARDGFDRAPSRLSARHQIRPVLGSVAGIAQHVMLRPGPMMLVRGQSNGLALSQHPQGNPQGLALQG
jgi:hypothetical protein